MTHGIIAQEVDALFPEKTRCSRYSNPLPASVLSVSAPPANNITFQTGQSEMLKVTEDGFYVRGVKVEADEKEAAAVYKAFKAFLVHHALTRN